jgi:glucosyl-dolichyl phosphate glucuronosyltransferase
MPTALRMPDQPAIGPEGKPASESHTVRPAASAIVCTHNRGAMLEQSILSLLRCERDVPFEVVVVDNASTDATRQVVARLMREHPGRNLRYAYEERLGLHHARHAGARAARSALLLYTDDDVQVDPGWVRAYVDAFGEHPDMVVAGGPAVPEWEADPPPWVADFYASDWFCLPLSLIDRGPEFLLSADGHFFGLNMAVRSEALRRFGGFRPEMIGPANVGSGEWGLQMAITDAGALIGWVPGARVRHWIPRSRMEPRYFERWVRAESASRMFERWQGQPRNVRAMWKDVWRIMRSNWRAWLRAAPVRRSADADAVRIRSDAKKGIYELTYLWLIVRRRDLRAWLDSERFGP